MGRYERIDVIVNNAVVRVPTKLVDTDSPTMEWVLKVNLLGPFNICRYALPGMIKRRQGSIINIKSSDSLKPGQDREVGNAPYRVSKAALTMFTVELAPEVRGYGIAVNAYYPGYLVSEAHSAMRRQRSELYGTEANRKGDPPEVCDESILFLATQTASTFTGQLVRRVDYGTTWGPGI
jgi:NAD(P)-dependent dehydrogenase (short-subunit alcohol dehydrogenase family)